jgi:tetratricopeptide (TPR) repeat protein
VRNGTLGNSEDIRSLGMPNPEQLKRGWDEVKIAMSLQSKSARERDYIAAVGAFYAHPDKENEKRSEKYLKAMERLYRRYPDDHEASAFYALALMDSDRDDDPSHAKRKEAAAILEMLFVLEPNHPGVTHYLIHTYDYPGMAELGLPAARRYAKIAPAAPHALHMPSHIFARLGLWQEDIASNLDSIAASRSGTSMGMGDEGHQFHAMEFLVYAYLQCGREAEAQKVIEDVKSLPKMKNMYDTDFDPRISALVEFSASHALELHNWKEAVDLPILTAADDADSSITYRARAIGASQLGDLGRANQNLRAIENLHALLVQEKKPSSAIKAVEDDRRVASAWISHTEGENEEAMKILREIASKEKGTFETDGDTTAHEMLGDMLLDMNRAEQALVEYEAELKLNPNRFNSLYGAGRAAELGKQQDKATAYYQQLIKVCAGGNSSRPELAKAQRFLSIVAGQN